MLSISLLHQIHVMVLNVGSFLTFVPVLCNDSIQMMHIKNKGFWE